MSKEKKKFKDTAVGKFLLNKIPNVVGAIADQSPVGNVIQAIIGGSEMSDEDKELALKKLELERAEMDGVTRRWQADARSDSWLAQNVRPLTLAVLTIAFIGGWYMQIEGLSVVKELLFVVFAGYFGGRSYEKVMGNKNHK
jgi:hypothetical protein|tara:strand:- start:5 stop:427 length:423 start_codon:yes stop_codon:yes gene_type:complete